MLMSKIPSDIGSALHYDAETGALTRDGREAGWLEKTGYIRVKFNGKTYRAHRVAWFLMTGEQPPEGCVVDHINMNRADNRWSNLRAATYTQSVAFSTRPPRTLPTGVSKIRKRFQAAMHVDGKFAYLGLFVTPEEASAAYQTAFNAHHGPDWNILSLTPA